MSRVFGKFEVNGGEFHTLFDTGARSSYAVRAVTARAPVLRLPQPVERHIGGMHFVINETCMLVGVIDGYGVATTALVVDKLFPDEYGRQIEIIIGAEAMEEWGIGVDMANRRLDFTHYARETTEGSEHHV